MLEFGKLLVALADDLRSPMSGARSRLAIRAAEFGPEADFLARRVDEKTTTTESPQP